MSDNEWPRQLPAAEQGEWNEESPGRSRVLMSAALVVVVLLVAGGVTWQLMNNESSPAAQPSAAPVPAATQPSVTPCPDPELSVVVAPEIAPVISAAAETLNPSGQRCPPVQVRAEASGTFAASGAKADVWIPSSSSWLKVAAADGSTWTTSGNPIAYSPVLLAGPEGIASLYIKDGKSSWAGLVKAVTDDVLPAVTMPDPLKDSVGLLSVHGVHAATARTTEDAGIAQLRALTLRSRLEDADADPAVLLDRMNQHSDATTAVYEIGVFPVLEQQLLGYQKTDHRIRLSGAPPVDGPVQADYPFAVRKGVKKDLAADLRAAVTKEAVEAAGFRTSPAAGALRLPEGAGKLTAPARQWSQYQNVGFQVLLLIDSSGSMNEKITDKNGKASTKAELLRESGTSAAQLFNAESNVGMWYFGTAGANGPAHVEQVPLGPVAGPVGDVTRREALGRKIGSYKPEAAAGTPLYQAVLDAVAEMRTQVKPGAATVVVVLTDGADGGTKYAMSNQQFLSRLGEGQDPAKPVPVIAVGYGPDANMTALQGMAKATGGRAIPARDPADLASAMAEAFLAAHGQS
ncbi:substrate-binding domain-containing protein [Actinoplanes rectilineatus]|uniref:substrate-binding domain-containing protein n=1 Tax=Actinoplanes rectilineatus TaxID=113571 RepID=UPI0005F28950|nr:substrate-binding domain-containing protein [Actinoplanes rectilineatus]